MPSHIFTRVGAWSDSIVTNRRSADVAKKDPADAVNAYHAADYMVYAQLQLGRDQEARRVMEEFKSAEGAKIGQFAGPYAAVAMPARMALERGDWAAAAQLAPLAPLGTTFAHCEAITSFSRALGAARMGNVAAAEQEAQRLEAHHKALTEAKNNYWAAEVEVQRIATAAWIAKAKGQNDEALRLMRAAADMEDKSEKHIVTPGRVVPARELLGEMLMELLQPAQALNEFEQSQLREPNRQRDKARAHYAKLVELTRDADTALPQVARAKTYLASR